MFYGPSVKTLKERLHLSDLVARQCKAVMSYGEY